jgi:hypothetical protein
MNEKIKELAIQANGPNPFYGTLKNQMTLLGDDAVKKFAELIVQECIEVFSKDMPDPTSPDYKLGSLNEVVDRVCNVAEHFGVK